MDPVAFRIGATAIYWYGVMVALGFLAGLWTASRRAPLAGISGEAVADLGFWLVISALLGARLFYVVEYWQEDFADKPLWQTLNLRAGGLVFYGGLIGGALAVLAYTRLKRLPLWKLADVLAPSVSLGHAFGRIGCFLNGCCYGKACSLPWAVHFPPEHITHGAGVHPTELYEAGANLILYAVLARWFRRRGFDGQVFALYLIGYGGARFVIEFFRGDYERYYLGGWATPGHLVSAIAVACGVVLYRWRRAQSVGEETAGR
ncbi:MAG: prolipoprotein diacylglyceryl transferase [Verrucomicrobia bacterium]|nr:prolipoprotein diacylglyceryl transferase [Verrucomicrobiota bacterium]